MAGGGRHVLVIEDEPNIVEAIRFILDRDGWRVSAHGRGGDAIEVIRDAAPDVLILDVMLPGRSGYEILADLRAEPTTAALPVLMLTARGQDRDRAQAERSGASHFISKPFANSDVLAALQALVDAG